MGNVLVVESDALDRRATTSALHQHGYEVICAATGEFGLRALAEIEPDVVLLALHLSDTSGFGVLRQIRVASDVPVIIVTSVDGQAERIEALENGADDYVVKPVDFDELVARMRAVLRRTAGQADAIVHVFGELEVDTRRHLVRRSGRLVHLTRTEYRLLEVMVENSRKLLTHTWLLRKVWGSHYVRETNYLHVYVRSLRRKLGDSAAEPTLIGSERGVGYRWLAGA